MDDAVREQLVPGVNVEVAQQIPHGTGVWVQQVRGTIVSFEQQQTGSWFAHAKGGKLWLDRLTIRKADGEISVLNLDQYTAVKVGG